jgi:hypothetical protein
MMRKPYRKAVCKNCGTMLKLTGKDNILYIHDYGLYSCLGPIETGTGATAEPMPGVVFVFDEEREQGEK